MNNTIKDPNTSFYFRKAENNDRFELYILVETILAGYGRSAAEQRFSSGAVGWTENKGIPVSLGIYFYQLRNSK